MKKVLVIIYILTLTIFIVFRVTDTGKTTYSIDGQIETNTPFVHHSLYLVDVNNEEFVVYDEIRQDITFYSREGELVKSYDFTSEASKTIVEYNNGIITVLDVRANLLVSIDKSNNIIEIVETNDSIERIDKKCIVFDYEKYCVKNNFISYSIESESDSTRLSYSMTVPYLAFVTIVISFIYSSYKSAMRMQRIFNSKQ